MSTGLTQITNSLPAARLRACQKWPYTSSALLSLLPVETKGLGTFAVDAYWRLYYDPAILTKWNIAETSGVLLHEVSHVIRNHSKRFARVLGYDPDTVLRDPSTDISTKLHIRYLAKIWNYAGDLEINDDLVAQKIPLPTGDYAPLLPEQFKLPNGLLAEQYYQHLRNSNAVQPDKCIVYTLKGEGAGKGQKGKGGKGKGEKGEGEGEGDGEGEITHGGIPGLQPTGSGADGCTREWESGKPDKNDPTKEDGINEAQADLIRHEVARRIQNSSKSQGSVPSGFRRWAEELLEPQIDYRRELITQVKQAIELIKGHSDFTYTRLPRKQLGGGLITPATVCPNVTVTVIIDTSGSMSEGALTEAVSELSGILKALPRQDGIRVLSCDSAVHAAQRCFRAEQVTLYGGGGTSMTEGVRVACEAKPRPQLCIIITDGFTDWPTEPICGVPCLAVIVSDGEESAPEWIKQVKLPNRSFAKDNEA